MKTSRGLLGRVAANELASRASRTDVAEIIAHLRSILNTRVGEAATVPDFGIEDLSDLTVLFPDAADTWANSIKATIEKYEPRLTNLRVRPKESDQALTVAFEISARLAMDENKKVVQFNTNVDSTGHFEIW